VVAQQGHSPVRCAQARAIAVNRHLAAFLWLLVDGPFGPICGDMESIISMTNPDPSHTVQIRRANPEGEGHWSEDEGQSRLQLATRTRQRDPRPPSWRVCARQGSV